MSSTTHASDARIVAEDLAYALPDGRALFESLTLSFGRERTGLIGPNGSGKTTLLRLLSGELAPTSGAVRRRGPVALLPQDARPPEGASVAALLGIEARIAALDRLDRGEGSVAELDLLDDDWDLPERAAAALAEFGLDHLSLDRRIGQVSGGEVTRLALAGLTLDRPDFLLLDEPTNHLDASGRQTLYAFVEGWSGGLVVVSHDRGLLRRVDRIVELSSLGVRTYGGGYDDYRARRDEEAAAAERELASAGAALRKAREKAREVRERQAHRASRGRKQRASANMPKILLNARKAQAEATGGRVRAMGEREVEEARTRAEAARRRVEQRARPRFDLPSAELPAGRTALALEGVRVQFPHASQPVLDGVSLRVVGPERVALVGPNGSGKTTLLRVAAGRLRPSAGTVRRLPDDEVVWLDQRGLAMDRRHSVLEAFRARHPQLDETAARHALARFLFAGASALQRVGTLSGGQRLRASLACALGGARPPSLVLLDEPTNHLDLRAVEALEDALRAYDGALLVASHDTDFLEAIGVERLVPLSR